MVGQHWYDHQELQELYANTIYSLEDFPGAMDERERESRKSVQAASLDDDDTIQSLLVTN